MTDDRSTDDIDDDALEALFADYLAYVENGGTPEVYLAEHPGAAPALLGIIDFQDSIAFDLTPPSPDAMVRAKRQLHASLRRKRIRRMIRVPFRRPHLWVIAGSLGIGLSFGAAFAQEAGRVVHPFNLVVNNLPPLVTSGAQAPGIDDDSAVAATATQAPLVPTVTAKEASVTPAPAPEPTATATPGRSLPLANTGAPEDPRNEQDNVGDPFEPSDEPGAGEDAPTPDAPPASTPGPHDPTVTSDRDRPGSMSTPRPPTGTAVPTVTATRPPSTSTPAVPTQTPDAPSPTVPPTTQPIVIATPTPTQDKAQATPTPTPIPSSTAGAGHPHECADQPAGDGTPEPGTPQPEPLLVEDPTQEPDATPCATPGKPTPTVTPTPTPSPGTLIPQTPGPDDEEEIGEEENQDPGPSKAIPTDTPEDLPPGDNPEEPGEEGAGEETGPVKPLPPPPAVPPPVDDPPKDATKPEPPADIQNDEPDDDEPWPDDPSEPDLDASTKEKSAPGPDPPQ